MQGRSPVWRATQPWNLAGERGGQLLGCKDCVVCMAAPRAFVFFPCRHLTHCEICQAAHKLTQCPLCREEGTPVRVFR